MLRVLAEAGGHGGHVIYDFGIVVTGAAVAAWVFHRLKLPSIFGYLLAGMLLGGGLGIPSPVVNFGVIHELSELGVVFLLFFIGMEFDLKRLGEMLWPSLIALILQTLAMLYLAHALASGLGWSTTSALFLGSLLAISSSMVTVRVLKDQHRLDLPHAQLAIGVLILEDILAVILLVILTGVAVTKQFDWDAAWLVTFLMGVFVFAVFVAGRILAPRILKGFHGEQGNRELTTIVSIGLVLGISILALRLDFSPALGAFLAGAILSQTNFVHAIEDINRSLYDLFGAVFFVTIGMLIEPALIIENIGWIVLLSILVVNGKVASCWLGMFLAGQPARTSFRAAAAKSQIGEFSFIIAGLGKSLGVTDDQLTSIAFGVAFVTILTTPMVARYSGNVFDAAARGMPERLKRFGDFYHDIVENVVSLLGRSRIIGLLKAPMGRIAANFLLVNAILIAGYFTAQYLANRFADSSDVSSLIQIGLWLGIAVCLAPFLLTIVGNLNSIVYALTDALFESQSERPILQGRIRNVFNGLTLVMTSLLLGALYVPFASSWLPARGVLVIVVVFLSAIALIFWRRLARFNQRLELMFMESFREQVHDVETNRREAVLKEIADKYPWEVKIEEFSLGECSIFAGKKLRETGLREKTGSTLIGIGRNGYQVFDPAPGTPLFPGDSLIVLGTAEQLQSAEAMFAETRPNDEDQGCKDQFDVVPVYISSGSALDGNTLAGAEVRKRYGVTVVGIQRGETRITSPKPDFMLRPGDVVYMVGLPSRLDEVRLLCDQQSEPEFTEASITGYGI